MRRKINIIPNEYTPIRSLLHYAVTEYNTYQDQYIKVMVEDAIMLSQDAEYRFRANRRMFRYSSYLSLHKREVVTSMNPQHLGIDEYRVLFEIFKNL